MSKKRGRNKSANPTCRQLLPAEKHCWACKKRRNANACELRRAKLLHPPKSPVTLGRKKRKKSSPELLIPVVTEQQWGSFFHDFLREVDEVKVPWHLPIQNGGTRRGRCRLKKAITREAHIKSFMLTSPIVSIVQKNLTTRSPAQPTIDLTESPPPTQSAQSPPPTIDSLISRKSKRRLIQIAYELLGSPPEFYPNGVSRWDGDNGVIEVIKKFLKLQSHRAKYQVRDVLSFVQRKLQAGTQDIDAGVSYKLLNIHVYYADYLIDCRPNNSLTSPVARDPSRDHNLLRLQSV